MPIFNLANSLGETYTTGEASLQALFEVLTMNCCTENWTKPASDNSHRKVEHDTIKESFQSWLKYHISSRSYRLGLGVPVLEATSEVASFLASSAIFPDFEDIAAYYERFLEILMEDPEVPASEWNREKFHREILDPILSFEQMSMYSLQRRLVITAKGFMGLVSRSGEVGDEVWILRGARVPFILRRLETGTYQLLGEVYLHGYMNGEVFTRDGMNVEESVRVTLE